MNIARLLQNIGILLLLLYGQAHATEEKIRSYHYGFFHPSGMDIIGYSVEKEITDGLYRYYTFGLPSGAAIGINYYANYAGNGLTATAGIGIGILFDAALAYQYYLKKNDYLKIGAGYTHNIGYNGIFPVLAYERRF